MSELDPSRASPETVAACVGHCLRLYGDDELAVPWIERLRSECRLPRRTREEIDAEIANIVRENNRNPKIHLCKRIEELVAEPYGPHGEPSAGSLPPVPRAVVGGTLSEPGSLPEPDCNCEQALELQARIERILDRIVIIGGNPMRVREIVGECR